MSESTFSCVCIGFTFLGLLTLVYCVFIVVNTELVTKKLPSVEESAKVWTQKGEDREHNFHHLFLPIVNNGMRGRQHLITGGNLHTNKRILLIHGGNSETQNAAHWDSLMPFFGSYGRVWAIDLLGHGISVPGPSRDIFLVDQVDGIIQTIDSSSDLQHGVLTLVARSSGTNVAFDLARKLGPHRVGGFVLIAPTLVKEQYEVLPEWIKDSKTLFFWADKDPIATSQLWTVAKGTFSNSTFIFVKVTEDEIDSSHTPEKIRPDAFKKAFTNWISSNKS